MLGHRWGGSGFRVLTAVDAAPLVLDRLRNQDGGWTLVELLVGTAVSLLVAAVATTMLIVAVRTQPVTTERAAQLQQGRVLIERISRELRQGEAVSGASASGLSIVTYVDSDPCGGASSATARLCRVTYACSATTCTRTEGNPDGSGMSAPTEVVTGLLDVNVFSYQPGPTDPGYVGIRLAFPAEDGGEAVTFQDGVALRNALEEPGA